MYIPSRSTSRAGKKTGDYAVTTNQRKGVEGVWVWRGLEGSIQNINLCKLMTNNCCFQQNFLLSLPTDCFWFCLLEIYLHCRSGRADVFALPSTMLFHFGFASGADHFFLRFLSSEFRQQKSKFRFHSGEDGQCHLIAANVIRISGPWFHHHGRSSRFRFRAGRSTWNSK